MTEPNRKLHSLKQAAELLDCSVDHLRDQHRAGKLRLKQHGRKYVVTDLELDRYIDEELDTVAPRR